MKLNAYISLVFLTGCVAVTRSPPVAHPDACGSHVDCYNKALKALVDARQEVARSIETFPIGSIILFDLRIRDVGGTVVGQRPIPKGWQLCNGRQGTINFTGRFPKGVAKAEEIGTVGGRADITSAGSHSHGGKTGPIDNGHRWGGGGPGGLITDHHHDISSDGAHDHGGDNEPPWTGVAFICRVE